MALLSSRLTVFELYTRGSRPLGREFLLIPLIFSCRWWPFGELATMGFSDSFWEIGTGANVPIRFSKFCPSHLNIASQSISGLEQIGQQSFWRESSILFTSCLWLAMKIALLTYGLGFSISDVVIISVVGYRNFHIEGAFSLTRLTSSRDTGLVRFVISLFLIAGVLDHTR